MARFITIYTVVAVLGSVLVYVSVPVIKAPPASQYVDSRSTKERRRQESLKEKITEARKEAVAIKEEIVAKDPAPEPETKKIPSPAKYRAAAFKDMRNKDWDRAIKVIEAGLRHYPENVNLLRLQKKAAARDQKWAVVWKDTTPIYNLSGKRLRKIPKGTFLQVKSEKKTGVGILYVSDVFPAGGAVNNVLVKPSAVAVADGIFKNADEKTRDLLLSKASIVAKIDKVEKARNQKIVDQNPHTAPYKKAKQEYYDFSAKVRALIAKRDESDGADRIESGDKLRELQPEGIKLKQVYESTKKSYDSYKKKNINIADSPELEKLKENLSEISKKIELAGI